MQTSSRGRLDSKSDFMLRGAPCLCCKDFGECKDRCNSLNWEGKGREGRQTDKYREAPRVDAARGLVVSQSDGDKN